MNKRIDFTNLGGFPATQYTFDWMQDSYRSCFVAMAALIGNKVIVSGMATVGPQTTSGWITYNGELIPFIGGVTQPTFLIEEVAEDRVFNDSTTKSVYYKKQARFGGALDFTELKRVSDVLAFFTAFNNLVTAYNDFVTNTIASIADLYSKIKVLFTGEFPIGDVNSTDKVMLVTHSQNILSDYLVTGSLVGLSGDYNNDNDVIWSVREVGANSFKLCLREVSPPVQNLRFDYVLIEK